MRAGLLRQLRSTLADLVAEVERSAYAWRIVPMGWDRPTGELVLTGRDHLGRGELVAFTPEAHTRFAGRLPAAGRHRIGDVHSDDPAEQCTIEAALIDLALRQQGISLAQLTGMHEVALQICWSFSAIPDPVPPGRLKIDHQPGADYANLALAVLDCKGLQAPEGLDGAVVIEDPAQPVRAPFALDQSVFGPADLVHPRLGRPTHVNLKATRMGGFLRALEVAESALDRGITPYWGGQWEAGIARRQAQQLAAIVCPLGPNDLAPVVDSFPLEDPTTVRVSLETPGFG